ncbi:class B sortase [Clostridium cibarium]|uniref:Class B sortase n=1 Tax=Clostridium cibarium TaxID=2762247 RepID=A0ABR8PQ52_9CLOT|nr:class B sortase [Clostridium cibarium]MBD7910277.1 class B sortase [Clostridium cibarium]
MGGKLSVKEIIRKVIFSISLIVFIVCAYKLYNIWSGYHNNSKAYDEVREYSPEKIDENGGEKFKFKAEDYQKLYEMNNDFKGWIYIPGTNISYPLAQTNNNDYYLNHNFKKEENSGGSIFISSNNTQPFIDKNTIIHGHHMKDGSMFADLMKFKEESFSKDTFIYINTKDKLLQYEVFSVFFEKANNESYQDRFSSYDEYVAYTNKLKEKSMFDLGRAKFTQEDKIITLSTCDYDVDDGRLLVCAKLVSSSDY